MTPEQIHNIGIAHGKLVDRLVSTQIELERLYQSQGGNWRRQKRQVALADEIDSLKKRIERAERLMEGNTSSRVAKP